MMICERCGREMPDTAAICPSCGTASSAHSRPNFNAPTDYGQNAPSSSPSYSAYSYNQQQYEQPLYSPLQPGSVSLPGYNQPYNTPPPLYSPVSVNIHMSTPAPSGNTAAVVVEVLLNIFLGIYGVGWLMAGETTAGVILLICSFFLYWPVIIVGILFTFGIGLVCLVPLAIGAIILNAILLNNAIKRQGVYFQAQPMQPFPPR